MKHFTSFIFALVAMFCMATSASAALDTSKTYYLKSVGFFASVGTTYIDANSSTKHEFRFASYDGGYSIQEVNTGKYIGNSGYYCVPVSNPCKWEVIETTGGYNIKTSEGSNVNKWFGAQSGKNKFYNNNGSAVLIELIAVGEPEPEPEPEPAPGPLENVALHNLAGDYLCIGSADMNVSSTEFKWDLNAVSGLTGAYQIKQNGANWWVNSGSYGRLSKANSTGNARHFYFYEITAKNATTVNATLVETPKSGKDYVVGVSNITPGYHGFYVVYGQLASGSTNRLDVIKINDSAINGSTIALIPESIDLDINTHLDSNNNPITSFDKVIWTLEGHTFDLTVPAAGYATLFFDKALAVPTGVTAYTLAENAGGWLDATAVTEIPANTGVVLQATAGDYNFEILETADAATSCLSGTLTEIDAPTDCYTFAVEGEPGFYKYTGAKLAANKAYYVASTSESNIRVNFDGMATALDNIVSAPAANEIFDLQGRRVLNAKNGLYIVNGKKVIR